MSLENERQRVEHMAMRIWEFEQQPGVKTAIPGSLSKPPEFASRPTCKVVLHVGFNSKTMLPAKLFDYDVTDMIDWRQVQAYTTENSTS